MTEINAFVGHSFNPSDEGVVRAFTEYFESIHELLPGFRWEHAEKPEPRLVTDKVLNLLANKNVFIGICTRKEIVISPEKIKRRAIWPKGDYFNAGDAIWKTSDWLIQEIGLALGRDLKIILLLEEGVKKPGELQGNIEYINFNRESPEKSFQKFVMTQ